MVILFSLFAMTLSGTASLASQTPAGTIEISYSHTHSHDESESADHHHHDEEQASNNETSQTLPAGEHHDSHTHMIQIAVTTILALPDSSGFFYLNDKTTKMTYTLSADPVLDRALGSIFRPPISA
ncbi:MAG: hypothetical protein KF681_08680 [Bdellovibrionaceae bacterium]|nr:hypothetical protein [Pseudobdellovibrionaceae bacterium]